MKDSFNIAIFGIGALGSLFGGFLSQIKNINLTLIGTWQEQLYVLKKDGLILTHFNGKQSHIIVNAINTISDFAPVDVVIILVKSYQTERVAPQIAPILKDDGYRGRNLLCILYYFE